MFSSEHSALEWQLVRYGGGEKVDNKMWGRGGHKRETEAQKEIRGAEQKKAQVDVTLGVDKEGTDGG